MKSAVKLVVKEASGGQKFGKVDELSLWRSLRLMIPANVHAPAHGLQRNVLLAGPRDDRLLARDEFNHRVSISKSRQAAPVLDLQRFIRAQLRYLGTVNTFLDGQERAIFRNRTLSSQVRDN